MRLLPLLLYLLSCHLSAAMSDAEGDLLKTIQTSVATGPLRGELGMIADPDQPLRITFHPRSWVVYSQLPDGTWHHDAHVQLGPDNDGVVMTIHFTNDLAMTAGGHETHMTDEQQPRNQSLTFRDESSATFGVMTNHGPYWNTYRCGALLSGSKRWLALDVAYGRSASRERIDGMVELIADAVSASPLSK